VRAIRYGLAPRRHAMRTLLWVVAGLVLGQWAVTQWLAEAFGGLYPPAAYSFCLTCHTRDLVNSLVNIFTLRWVGRMVGQLG